MSKLFASEVIKIAKSQVGYLEKKSNSMLDDFKANVGSNNYTKYARDFNKFAGTNLQANAWCDMFADWIFIQAYGLNKAKELLGGFSAYTPTSAQYFKNMKRWYTSSPKEGDVIFFKNSERICHVGIVAKVTSTTVYTVEGNTSSGNDVVVENGGCVAEKSYKLNNTRIAGYGRPNYDIEIKPIEKPKTSGTITAPTITANVYHTVKSGDTLSKIANTYKTTVDALVKLNGLKNPNVLSVGQKLCVSGYEEYKVVKGDSLSLIAKKLLGDANRHKEITNLNGLKSSVLNIGQVLKIPLK